ncbi:hypothetical protein BJ508DRAFT_179822 [Ascobolus immersus RN42]|uniref:Uncharacterized protein n=1 Tax=Ascobolus immersus RN42 TaxID=1160509 RepID=A0A3N4HYG2_ASCIM|nr:hypothetical protein BJ508DRAFT_179822 [Ascobolus immersus RN42]
MFLPRHNGSIEARHEHSVCSQMTDPVHWGYSQYIRIWTACIGRDIPVSIKDQSSVVRSRVELWLITVATHTIIKRMQTLDAMYVCHHNLHDAHVTILTGAYTMFGKARLVERQAVETARVQHIEYRTVAQPFNRHHSRYLYVFYEVSAPSNRRILELTYVIF